MTTAQAIKDKISDEKASGYKMLIDWQMKLVSDKVDLMYEESRTEISINDFYHTDLLPEVECFIKQHGFIVDKDVRGFVCIKIKTEG